MSGNKSFARSMNGINNIEINEVQFPDGSTITSASNLVQLDTTNDFTSNNSFNNNLPTSTKTPEVGDLTDVMILNKYSADLLYSGTDENDYITAFTRDGNTGVITLTQSNTGDPITSETITTITDTQLNAIDNAVLKTTDQEIDGIKTFVDIPKIKVPTGGTLPTPTDNAELTTKNYVDTTAVLKTTAQEIDGEKTFVDFPKIKLDENNNTPNPTANNQFATKKYVDDNAGGSTPTNMVTTDTTQVISGLKQFSNQRPKAFASATTTTATSQELITKGDGDSFYAPKNTIHGFSQKQHTTDDQIKYVVRGNPSDTNPNSNGGLIHSFLTCYVNTYNGDYEGVSLDFSVVGEWNNKEYDKGVAIARAKYVNGNYAYDTILRAPVNGSSTRFISNFTIAYHTDIGSTMESCNGKYIDLTIENNNLYSYTILLVNSSTHTSTHRFYLNRTESGTATQPYERGTSCITAQLFN